MHDWYAAPSRLQPKVDPASVELNSNVALVLVTVPVGPLVMVVFGGVVSAVPPLLVTISSGWNEVASRESSSVPSLELVATTKA